MKLVCNSFRAVQLIRLNYHQKRPLITNALFAGISFDGNYQQMENMHGSPSKGRVARLFGAVGRSNNNDTATGTGPVKSSAIASAIDKRYSAW